MNVLAVDLGNTRCKCSVLLQGELAQEMSWPQDSPPEARALQAWLTKVAPDGISLAGMIATGGSDTRWEALLSTIGLRVLRFNGLSKGLIHNRYGTPHTLGADRWAAINAAWAHAHLQDGANPRPVLVFDLGTALTSDLADAQRNYLGGHISPGLRMRLNALAHYTARLPQLQPDPEHPPTYPGTDTASSLQVGAWLGLEGEMEHILQAATHRLGQSPVVFLTGGDAQAFEKRLKTPNFVRPHLVSEGIYHLVALAQGHV